MNQCSLVGVFISRGMLLGIVSTATEVRIGHTAACTLCIASVRIASATPLVRHAILCCSGKVCDAVVSNAFVNSGIMRELASVALHASSFIMRQVYKRLRRQRILETNLQLPVPIPSADQSLQISVTTKDSLAAIDTDTALATPASAMLDI